MCALRVEPPVYTAACLAGPRRGVIVVEAPRSGGHAKLQAGSHIEQITSLVVESEHCIAHRILGSTPSPLIRTEVQGPGKVRAELQVLITTHCLSIQSFHLVQRCS